VALKDKIRLVCICSVIGLFMLSASFGAGYYTSLKSQTSKYSKLDSDFKDAIRESNLRIAELTRLTSEERNRADSIEGRNQVLEKLNREQRRQLDNIIGTNTESGELIQKIEQELSGILNGQ
jgi:hypothetical protein